MASSDEKGEKPLEFSSAEESLAAAEQWARWRRQGSYEWARDSQWEGAREAQKAAEERRVRYANGPSEFHISGPCPQCGYGVTGSGTTLEPLPHDESYTLEAVGKCEHCGASVTLEWQQDPI